ncbi:MAG: putative beta-lysine N-acetyltransferase [Desulfitobacterium hafniense]|nr:putative beta-lysine N-acetyltransferase [Desulfitobacterium hafniense]
MRSADRIINLTSSNFTVDQFNKRLIINGYPYKSDVQELAPRLKSLAMEKNLEKIWLWAYDSDVAEFARNGFKFEGRMHGRNDQPVVSMAYFMNPLRGISNKLQLEDDIIQSIYNNPVEPLQPLSENYELRLLEPSDTIEISNLLKSVFVTYPTPIDPNYIFKQMSIGCLFAGVFYKNKLISVSAAYPDDHLLRCEMTDCATKDEFRGQNLTERLLMLLETEILKGNDYILYTLARARSYGVNRVFYKLGYNYQGCLINNCHIAGNWEDLNLWVK